MERKAVSTRRRFEIFKRDSFACQYCGRVPPSVVLHIDHIIPVCRGGGNGTDNLVTSCAECNLGKAGIPLSAIPESLAEKAARIKEAEKQLKAYRKVIQEQEDRIARDAWGVIHELFGENRNEISNAWLLSVVRFLDRLELHEVMRAATYSAAKCFHSDKRTFTYFCAICWSIIKESDA